MVGSSVLVRSCLSMSVQPPIANFPDNPVEEFGSSTISQLFRKCLLEDPCQMYMARKFQTKCLLCVNTGKHMPKSDGLKKWNLLVNFVEVTPCYVGYLQGQLIGKWSMLDCDPWAVKWEMVLQIKFQATTHEHPSLIHQQNVLTKRYSYYRKYFFLISCNMLHSIDI